MLLGRQANWADSPGCGGLKTYAAPGWNEVSTTFPPLELEAEPVEADRNTSSSQEGQ